MQLFYTNPNRSFYVREITRKIDEQINSVRRELANLLSIGIIVSDTTNNRLYYEVNQQYSFYGPLSGIFGQSNTVKKIKQPSSTVKSGGIEATQTEQERLKSLGHLEIVLYTGQFTRDETSGIDMLIVGDVNPNALQKFVTELEVQEGKEIRYAIMPMQEFEYRRQINDRFISTVLDSKKQVLVDINGLL